MLKDKARLRFGESKKGMVLMAVVHVASETQAVRNVALAERCLLDGVFLIVHGKGGRDLLKRSYDACRAAFPLFFIGVNVMMGRAPLDLFAWVQENVPSADAVWTDNCFANTPRVCERMAESKKKAEYLGLHFGGIAFKHQEKVHPEQDEENLPQAAAKALCEVAKCASSHVDVVVTSGTKTGAKASLAKVRAVQKGSTAMVAVSGVGIDVREFAGACQIVLAATAISKLCSVHGVQDNCEESFCELDEQLVKKWVELR